MPLNICVTLGRLTSLRLCSLIYKMGGIEIFTLEGFWRIQLGDAYKAGCVIIIIIKSFLK